MTRRKLSEEELEAAYEEVKKGGALQKEVAKRLGVEPATLSWHFKRLDLKKLEEKIPPALDEKARMAYLTEMVKQEVAAFDTAFKMVEVLSREYRPLMNHLLKICDNDPEAAMRRLCAWYEERARVEEQLNNLRIENAELKAKLKEAVEKAKPNYIYELQARLLEKHVARCLRAAAAGYRIDYRSFIRAYQADLQAIEERVRSLYPREAEEML
jgi:Mn-dependent DtxR family transcriptional regulator